MTLHLRLKGKVLRSLVEVTAARGRSLKGRNPTYCVEKLVNMRAVARSEEKADQESAAA